MAASPTTALWSKLIVQLGNGASPEIFSSPCGLTSKGINLTADSSDVVVPDCADPSLPAWVERAITSLSGTISGSGILAMEALPTWRAYYLSAAAKNARVLIDMPLANNGGYFQGSFICTALNITGNIDDAKIRLDTVTMISNGAITWVPASS